MIQSEASVAFEGGDAGRNLIRKECLFLALSREPFRSYEENIVSCSYKYVCE